jgi:hypothetical protein
MQQQQQFGHSDLNNSLSSSTSFGYQADTAAAAAAAGAAAGVSAGQNYSRNASSQGLYSPGSVSRRASSASSGGSFSSALPPACGYGPAGGFTSPWNPAAALYRPPSQQQTLAVTSAWPGSYQQQQQPQRGMLLPPYAGAAAVGDGADTYAQQQQYSQQYSQYAVPYDVAKQRVGSSYGQQQLQQPTYVAAPHTPQVSTRLHHQPQQQQQQQQQKALSPQAAGAGLHLQPSSSLAGNQSPSNRPSGMGSVYVRQPSWVGPQSVAAAAVGDAASSEQQSQQQQLSKPSVSKWNRSSRGWGTSTSTAAVVAPASASAGAPLSSSSQGPAPVKQADSEEFPSLCTVYASITNGSKQQANKRDLEQKQTDEQQQQPGEQQQQQAQAPARKPHVSPFAACQAIAEEENTQGSGASVFQVSMTA